MRDSGGSASSSDKERARKAFARKIDCPHCKGTGIKCDNPSIVDNEKRHNTTRRIELDH